MATNTYNNIGFITKAAMNVLTNALVLVPRVNRTYEKEFDQGAGKVGDTVNARIPGYGQRRSGKVASPASFADSYVPVTVTQQNASLQFSSKDLALNVEDGGEFERSVLGPQMAALVNGIDADGFALYSSLSTATGTPGTQPTDLSHFLNASAEMASFATPQDDQVYAFLNPFTQASMVNGLKLLTQDASEVAKQYKKGVMGTAGGMSFLMSQNVKTHTVGTFSGTPAMNGATLEGATTLAINGWGGATDSLKKGDVIQIAGVYAVNPVSKESTGQLMKFVVTADYAASGSAMAALPISPAIYTSASGSKQNVTALPLNTAAVTIYGSATAYSAKVSPANLVLHRDCLAFAAVDLPMNLPADMQRRSRNNDLGISIRVTKDYDGINDDMLYRLDVMYGWAVLRDKFGARVHG